MADDQNLDQFRDLEQEIEQTDDTEMAELPHPVDWMALSVHEWGDELDRLRLWVAQMTTEWALPSSVILPCWEQHPDLVQLWSAARDSYDTLYHEMQPGTGPIDFHRYFSWVRQEVAAITGTLRCTTDEHVAPRVQSWAREIAEEGEMSREFAAQSARVDLAVQNHLEAGRGGGSMNVVFVDFTRGR
ncbi:hypothetical protein MHY20_08940 [Helcobacillus sp. ACRRO]|uniref:hypothetical protein n=1 Tax=Helcobacillus sp. ACRRO TaxID=2918202 RepID=UPI001EF5E27F|nr:hypothetical protein [Helcobacillus sp. ACRRO]MCG7427728.1 hypothetical protein [Helcobacillus sp. ACRRO]